jgi:hypothetical protein
MFQVVLRRCRAAPDIPPAVKLELNVASDRVLFLDELLLPVVDGYADDPVPYLRMQDGLHRKRVPPFGIANDLANDGFLHLFAPFGNILFVKNSQWNITGGKIKIDSRLNAKDASVYRAYNGLKKEQGGVPPWLKSSKVVVPSEVIDSTLKGAGCGGHAKASNMIVQDYRSH